MVAALFTDAALLTEFAVLPPDFPQMLADPASWLKLMLDAPLWAKLVAKLFFSESACDPPLAAAHAAARTHRCAQCSAAFSSAKALASHSRAKHGTRSSVKAFVKSSRCPCCGVDFRQRFRCFAHLSDSRRPKCREWVLAHCAPMNAAGVAQLDTELRQQRKAAWRAGSTHPLAEGPARRDNGRITGRVQF